MTRRARAMAAAALAVAAVATASLLVAARSQEPFPHLAHAGLFPLCSGCHLGVETGERAEYYPEPAACASCHDGVREAVVEWRGPTPRPTNLDFEHTAHAAAMAGAAQTPLECAACHTQPGAPRMAVEPPIPGQCLDCHAHAARDHYVDAACAVCHVPLAVSELPPGRVGALPVPATHHSPDFLAAAHGLQAEAALESCTTCHVREQCVGCHVAVGAGSPVAAIPAAEGRVAVHPLPARYPLPPSHLQPAWERVHGQVAAPAACATCHTRESCSSCHLSPLPGPVAAMPAAADAVAPGALVVRRAPESHATPFFAMTHGPLAAARPQTCTTCHDRANFCAACHEPGPSSPAHAPGTGTAAGLRADPRVVAAVAALVAAADTPPRPAAPPARAGAPGAGGFHPPNYVLRHSAEAFGRRLDCSSCHNTQRFCRDCHISSGRGATGRLGPTYHDAEPVWLLRHGQAARQTLESCTACHTQRDCMQCHSQLGAFRVSPHGPGFDARRAQRANPQICRACHLGDPLAGG